MLVSPSLLRRQANAARPDQPGIGRLEPPEGPADCPLQIDGLIVRAAERKVGCCSVAVRYRHKTENDAARVDLDDTAKTGQCGPEIAAHVVMHAVRTAIPGHEGSGLYRTEGRMRRIFRALRAAHRRAVLECAVPDPAASKIADGEQRVVR